MFSRDASSRYGSKPCAGRSPYSIKVKASILSKCFLLSVANFKPFAMAVAAMNKSAISICFRLRFSSALMSTAILEAALSKEKTSTFRRRLSQNAICPNSAPL